MEDAVRRARRGAGRSCRLAGLLAACALTACGEAPAPEEIPLRPQRGAVLGLHDVSGRHRQIARTAKEATRYPRLAPLSAFPGQKIPPEQLDELGVTGLSVAVLTQRWRKRNWAFIDVRSALDVARTGTIPGAHHHPYRFEGDEAAASETLSPETVAHHLATHEGVVFLGSGALCPRAFNAAIAAVECWKIPGHRVSWFPPGVPGWNVTALVPERSP